MKTYQNSLRRAATPPTIGFVTTTSVPRSELVRGLLAAHPEAAGREADVVIVRAPGRVNLIGEHTDYNGGFVLPFAIDMDVRIVLVPVGEPRIRVTRADTGQTATISLDPFPPRGDAWHDYMAGTAWAMSVHGQPIGGFDGLLVTTLPIGSGLSSSAALEVVTAWALSAPDGPVVAPLEVARIAQYAENEHVGVRCGLMDQFASACGVDGSALLFDCRSTEWRAVALPEELALVVIHSGVSHGHADNEYNDRRAACERVVAAIAADDPAVTLLRDIDMSRLEAYQDRLDPIDYRRAFHVLTENERVLGAVAALEANDHTALGELMAGSQASMRDHYAITCPEIDTLVEIAVGVPGVIGSRMTGGGFGGCTITLVEQDAVDGLRRIVEREYPARTGCDPQIWTVSARDGAGVVPGG
jgi:galactokinase